MKYDIGKFEALVEEGYLSKSEKGDLVLYGYTDHCTFSRNWNEYTRVARGLVLNKLTGEVVARPFEKFFNLGEIEETLLVNLPSVPHVAYEKVDGSLGILFCYNGQWDICTRGSFYSEQAVKASELLKKYDLQSLEPILTYLVEIVYPENKIIVSYGAEEKLVLLAAFITNCGYEMSRFGLVYTSAVTGMPLTVSYDHTVGQMLELQKTLPKDQEGFVVRYENGLRVKIKGVEYMRISKIINHMSPLSIWDTMKDGKADPMYLAQVPEEFRVELDAMASELELRYTTTREEIYNDFNNLPTREKTQEAYRTVGLFLKEPNDIKHKSAMFSLLKGTILDLDSYIMKQIRPTRNVL